MAMNTAGLLVGKCYQAGLEVRELARVENGVATYRVRFAAGGYSSKGEEQRTALSSFAAEADFEMPCA